MTTHATRTPFDIRRSSFEDTIEFYAPGLKHWETSEWKPANSRRFLPISVTGDACALQCDHCQANVLKGMISAQAGKDLYEIAQRLWSQGTDGLLVSGGSKRDGGVPLDKHMEAIARIKRELPMKVVVHTGVVYPDVAEGLADAGVDAVMLDIIGADETIKEVYHLDLTTREFDRSLALLAEQGLRIIPHIVLGMHYGRFIGEHNALEMISKYPVSTLILVVLMPLTGRTHQLRAHCAALRAPILCDGKYGGRAAYPEGVPFEALGRAGVGIDDLAVNQKGLDLAFNIIRRDGQLAAQE